MVRAADVFCCRELFVVVNDNELLFKFDLSKACFAISSIPQAYDIKDFRSLQDIYCCPWCGKPIVKDLWDEWAVCVEKILGSHYNLDADYLLRLPSEFQTDEWWRKRNLKLLPKKPFDQLLATKKFYDVSQNNDDRKEWVVILQNNFEVIKKMTPLCCIKLYKEANKVFDCAFNNEYVCSDFPMIYEPEKRRFFLASVSPFFFAHWEDFPSKKCWRLLKLQIYYCFWCGKELPKSLSKEWFEIVTKKFGVRNVYSKAELQKKLPVKFLTDEWWREAGL